MNGNVQGKEAGPLTHVMRVMPQLDSWQRVTRYVGARPEDAERVRQATAVYMRDGARKAHDAGIL